MCLTPGEIGGYMGLLLGASALTVIEILDLIFYNGMRKIWSKSSKERKNTEEEQDNSRTNVEVSKHAVKYRVNIYFILQTCYNKSINKSLK